MDAMVNEYLDWIMAKKIDGCTNERTENGVNIDAGTIAGAVNVYELNNMNVIELRLTRRADDESIFFLHFELTDLANAKKMYYEMAEVLENELNRKVDHVLLCCTCGITTTFFSNKLNETARSLGLDLDFAAVPIEMVREQGKQNDYVAVLLAPQVGHQKPSLEEALPNTLIIQIPPQVFGAYDAAGCLRLVVEALVEKQNASGGSELRIARDFDRSVTVLAITLIPRESREATINYRLLDHGKLTLSGQIVKRELKPDDITNLVDNLKDSGWDPTTFDAIGIAGPWRVSGDVTYFKDGDAHVSSDFASELEKKLSTQVFVHNNGLAGAAGCYVQQDEFENVAFHAQALGEAHGAEGFVIRGHPYEGAMGMAGQLGLIAKTFTLSMSVDNASWRYDGLRELISSYLANIACTIAPEVIYVWCDLIPEAELLRGELVKVLPESVIPQLRTVDNYEEVVLVGEMALCLMALHRAKKKS